MAECTNLPQKRYYRQRAHSNPLSDHSFDYPTAPSQMNWNQLYPLTENTSLTTPDPAYDNPDPADGLENSSTSDPISSPPPVEFLDIGCGYGGLLIELATLFPRTRILGLEIRVRVFDYVRDRIKALRSQYPNSYNNVAVLRTNAMKYLPNYFTKGQLSKMFFLFPDPHFKKSKHKFRIIQSTLLSEYAYIMKEGGLVYMATDVKDLHEWMRDHFLEHPLFEHCQETHDDPIVPLLDQCTEEGKKVSRNGGTVYKCVFKRVRDPFTDKNNS